VQIRIGAEDWTRRDVGVGSPKRAEAHPRVTRTTPPTRQPRGLPPHSSRDFVALFDPEEATRKLQGRERDGQQRT
jgi:hypothetical protein